ncbi:MAG: class I SAM-dependent methyltransferase [Limisphaerales bacterium]
MSDPNAQLQEGLAPHGVLKDHYQNPVEREKLVRQLFDRSAVDYDRLSKLLSFGTDRWYRRQVMNRLNLQPGTRHLDVATGTGLVIEASLAAGTRPHQIVGLDPSAGMLGAHGAKDRVQLLQGRGEQLPFASSSFDLVTMGYALRHVADLRQLFEGFYRVLKPGGKVAIMEITNPKSGLLRRMIRFYFASVVPLLLGKTGRQRSAQLMAYYCSTIEECVPPYAIAAALVDAGFPQVVTQSTGPVLTDFIAHKPAA